MRLTVRRIFVVQDGFIECFGFFCHFPRKMSFAGIFGILRNRGRERAFIFPPSEQPNRAVRHILYARSQAAGTPGCPSVEGGRTAEGRSEHSQRREAAMAGCGPRTAYRHYDTCAGYASQRRAPRHGNGGRHLTYGAVLPAAVCSALTSNSTLAAPTEMRLTVRRIFYILLPKFDEISDV